MVLLGIVSTPDRVPEGFDLVELQFEKSVPKKAQQLPNMRYTVHAPYYGTIATDKEQKAKDARMRILDASAYGRKVNANLVITRAGFYAKKSADEVFEIVKRNCKELRGSMSLELGIETQPRASQFGSLNEVLALAKETKIIPVLNLGAMLQREGQLNIERVLERVRRPYCHYDTKIDIEKLAKIAEEIGDVTLVAENEAAAKRMATCL